MSSIRSQLAVWYTVALVATVLAFGITASIVDRRARYADLDQRLATEAHRGALTMGRDQASGGHVLDEVNSTLAGLRLDLQAPLDLVADYLVVVDTASRIVFGSVETRRFSQAAAEALRLRVFSVSRDQEVFDLTLDGENLRFVGVPVPRAAGVRAVIVAVAVGAPTRDLDLAPQRILASMLFVAPLILLSSVAVGYVLSTRALRPLGRTIDELEAISDGRSLHRRLPAPAEPGDEMDRLAHTLNAMLSRLETSFTALRRFIADASHELKTPLTVLRADEEAARLVVFLDVETAFLNLQQAQDLIPVAKLNVTAAQENLDIANGEYKEGLGSPIQVADAEANLSNAMLAYIQSLYDFQIARASLEKAMGSR